MKEFIDKLIERLEEMQNDKYINGVARFAPMERRVFDVAISIVNELAEEYKVSEMPTGWISVSERLPEVNKKVLAFDVFSGISIEKLEEDEEFIESVIAWMPLPAPYTEGE